MPDAADPIYIAVQSYCVRSADGLVTTIKEGARYRASSGLPGQHPSMWVSDGATAAEIGAAQGAVMARALHTPES
jgi:hypothetical protein